MTQQDNPSNSGQARSGQSKVSSLLDRYHLPGLGDELVEYWTQEKENRMSLRELAEYFNKALLAESLSHSSVQTLDGEVSNYYRLLTDDDVSSGTRIEAENQLEQHDIDIEELRSDFVSRQSIHTYLTKDRGVSYQEPTQSKDARIESLTRRIGRLKNRLIAVTEQAIIDLSETDQLPHEEVQVTALVQVHCTNCGTTYTISEYLSNGGCSCDAPLSNR